jgi:proteasome accessory factor A
VKPVPKVVGADFELGNFILGLESPRGTGAEASRALLRAVVGVAAGGNHQPSLWQAGVQATTSFATASAASASAASASAWNLQDWGRKFLRENGGSIYVDLDHLELCTPETISAYDHGAVYRAMLRFARRAQVAAGAELPDGQSLQVLVNNSDGRSHSYGSHWSFLLNRDTWRHVTGDKPHHLAFLATHQLSSMIFTGQGKVGAENGRPAVDFQLSQRADFVEALTGLQTTFRRPLVNTRDESLADEAGDLARLHVIWFDAGLCPIATLLKVGTMQIVLALLEDGVLDASIAIDDPVAAAVCFSHDPTLEAAVPLVDGRTATALALQQSVFACARHHFDRHGLPTVPRAGELLELWEAVLAQLEARDWDALAPRLDWVLKRTLLARARERAGVDWDAPELRHLDQIYGSLDPDEGLFLQCERAGLVEQAFDEERIAHFECNPPEDTRAWTRAMVLRHFDEHEIVEVDWDRVELELRDDDGLGLRRFVLALPDPVGFTRADGAEAIEVRQPI